MVRDYRFNFIDKTLSQAHDLPKDMWQKMDGKHIRSPNLAQWFFSSYINYGLYKWCIYATIPIIKSPITQIKVNTLDPSSVPLHSQGRWGWGGGLITWHMWFSNLWFCLLLFMTKVMLYVLCYWPLNCQPRTSPHISSRVLHAASLGEQAIQ